MNDLVKRFNSLKLLIDKFHFPVFWNMAVLIFKFSYS